MNPPTYTLTPDQIQHLHGAVDVAVQIKCEESGVAHILCEESSVARSLCEMIITARFDSRTFTSGTSIGELITLSNPEQDRLQRLADNAVYNLEVELFNHMRPRMCKHLASLPAHALRKSIHQIEDEWLTMLDKPWLDFVAREIQLAHLEDSILPALSTKH